MIYNLIKLLFDNLKTNFQKKIKKFRLSLPAKNREKIAEILIIQITSHHGDLKGAYQHCKNNKK
jgi:hypothetical protein